MNRLCKWFSKISSPVVKEETYQLYGPNSTFGDITFKVKCTYKWVKQFEFTLTYKDSENTVVIKNSCPAGYEGQTITDMCKTFFYNPNIGYFVSNLALDQFDGTYHNSKLHKKITNQIALFKWAKY